MGAARRRPPGGAEAGPPAGTPLLRYERGLCAAEARYFRLVAERAPQVPVPRFCGTTATPRTANGWSPRCCPAGRSLTWPGRASRWTTVRCGTTSGGSRRGAPGDRRPVRVRRRPGRRGDLAGGVHGDARRAPRRRGRLGRPAAGDPERLRALVRRHADVLDEVRRPALLHFDCWDGNVLAAPDPDGRLRLCGLVDGERFLYGDPLLDLVSPLLFRRIEDEPAHPLLHGYRAAAAEPLVLDASARRRLGLYRLHLYLLMTVEMPSRGMTALTHPGRHARLAVLLDEEIAALGSA
ncbi:phosphotransferase [Micromonospora sp. M12]